MGSNLIPLEFLCIIKSDVYWMTNEIIYTCFSAWVNKIQVLMAAASFGEAKIPKGNGPYSVGCTDLMFDHTKKVMLNLYNLS